MIRFLATFLLLTGLLRAEEPPRNVILLIGDGMGVSQVTLARLASEKPLSLDSIPVTGLVITTSGNAWVTDSAAAATAIGSGTKTNNFSLGVDAGGKKLVSILERAEAKGVSTGLVTTTRITHATPAAFASHVPLRMMEDKVAVALLDSGVDLLMGGGKSLFDGGLLRKYRDRGCVVDLYTDDHMPYVLDRQGEPSLADMTRKALDHLKGAEKGFFVMIEGGRIDHACHASDAASAIHETLDFDAAVAVALDFARRDGRTLVVVTADHATGGMAITEQAQILMGPHLKKVRASVGRMAELAKESPFKKVLAEWAGVDDVTGEEAARYRSSNTLVERQSVIGQTVSFRLGITFIPIDYRLRGPDTTSGHDGAMVPIYAEGPGANRFGGTFDNTEISVRLRAITGW